MKKPRKSSQKIITARIPVALIRQLLDQPENISLFHSLLSAIITAERNQKNWRPPAWTYKKFRKRIETVFSRLSDSLMMIRNYAKQSCGLFTLTAAKIAAMTFMQYVNFINHRPIGQIKYSLI